MGWQTEGFDSVFRGITVLPTGGSVLRIMLIQTPGFNFALTNYTFASVQAHELVNVATGYTSGIGGTLCGNRDVRVPVNGPTIGLDIANLVFTNVRLNAGTAVVQGYAIMDMTNSICVATLASTVPIPVDATTNTTITMSMDDTVGSLGAYRTHFAG